METLLLMNTFYLHVTCAFDVIEDEHTLRL